MLPIFDQLRQMSVEAQILSEALDQLNKSLNEVAGNEAQELDLLHGFLEYHTQKLANTPSSKITVLKADAEQLLLELHTALGQGQGRFEIQQKVSCYYTIMLNLHNRLENICLALGG